jgi:hypothetical protein
VTHADIWYLAKRLVLEVRWLLVFCHLKVDWNELVWDIKLFRNQGNAARAGGHRGSVKFECHEVIQVKLLQVRGEMMGVTPVSP